MPVAGIPALAVKPLVVMLVMLYVTAEGPSTSSARIRPLATSLQTVVDCGPTTGSGLIGTVSVNVEP